MGCGIPKSHTGGRFEAPRHQEKIKIKLVSNRGFALSSRASSRRRRDVKIPLSVPEASEVTKYVVRGSKFFVKGYMDVLLLFGSAGKRQ